MRPTPHRHRLPHPRPRSLCKHIGRFSHNDPLLYNSHLPLPTTNDPIPPPTTITTHNLPPQATIPPPPPPQPKFKPTSASTTSALTHSANTKIGTTSKAYSKAAVPMSPSRRQSVRDWRMRSGRYGLWICLRDVVVLREGRSWASLRGGFCGRGCDFWDKPPGKWGLGGLRGRRRVGARLRSRQDRYWDRGRSDSRLVWQYQFRLFRISNGGQRMSVRWWKNGQNSTQKPEQRKMRSSGQLNP